MMDTTKAAKTRPCRPNGCSGARYNALAHCSLAQPGAPDHLGPFPRVSRGALDVRDLQDCRPYPPLPSFSLRELTRARPWTLPTMHRGPPIDRPSRALLWTPLALPIDHQALGHAPSSP